MFNNSATCAATKSVNFWAPRVEMIQVVDEVLWAKQQDFRSVTYHVSMISLQLAEPTADLAEFFVVSCL